MSLIIVPHPTLFKFIRIVKPLVACKVNLNPILGFTRILIFSLKPGLVGVYNLLSLAVRVGWVNKSNLI